MKRIITVTAGSGNVFADDCKVTVPSKCCMIGCDKKGAVPITIRLITETGHSDKDGSICESCDRWMKSTVVDVFKNVSVSAKAHS